MGAGLGNQMYEYAFYRQLKEIYPDEIIKLDVRYAFPAAHNGIELFDIFRIDISPDKIATIDEVKELAWTSLLNGEGFQGSDIRKKILKKLRIHPRTMRIQYDFTEFYDYFMEVNTGASYYYYGPFANYQYFQGVEEEIRREFVFCDFEEESNRNYANRIKNTNSTSIHLRKGDYVKEGIALIPKEYYRKASEYIEKMTGNSLFFVFSDDKAYAADLFWDREKFVIVEGNEGKSSYRDMQLMSMCRNNIIANSTFSFWGAFLNNNQKKIVIVPKMPFTGMKNPFACDDWILM